MGGWEVGGLLSVERGRVGSLVACRRRAGLASASLGTLSAAVPASLTVLHINHPPVCRRHTLPALLQAYGTTTTVSSFMNVVFGYESSMVWWCVLIVLAYCIFFRGLATVMLAKVNFQRR